MSITKPYTFQAGTKARANEVNANFDALFSQANTNISNIEANARDIDELDDTKAELNGNSSQRFAAANPINDTDVVNKQSLSKSIGNSIDYINGLLISKDTNSPNDTIIVSAGSCYDSDRTVVLALSGNTSKQNTNQGANTTYNVYIIGNDNGTSTDVLISSSSVEPALPSGYTKYRLIGNFTTDSNSKIKTINSNSNSISRSDMRDSATGSFPNYSAGYTIGIPYTVTEYGFVYAGVDGIDTVRYVKVNGKPVVGHSGYSGGRTVYGGGVFPVSPNDNITCDRTLQSYYFYPAKL